MLHHDQVKTLQSMWGKRWQEHLYICRRDHMRTTKMQSAISGIFSDPSTTIVFRASDCRKAQVGRCSKALKALPLVVRLDHTACRSSAGLLQVGEELLLCYLNLSSWAEVVRSTVEYSLGTLHLPPVRRHKQLPWQWHCVRKFSPRLRGA